MPKDFEVQQPSIERCEREIAEIEQKLRAGHPDVEGLCRGLMDWSEARRMILKRRNQT